jgi:thymidylate kinase
MLKHSFVLCARYDLSTFTYQNAQGMSMEEIYKRHGFDGGETLIPDITIIIDILPSIAISRIHTRDTQVEEFFEKDDFLKKAYESLHSAVSWWEKKDTKRKILVVDGNGSEEETTKNMLEAILEV